MSTEILNQAENEVVIGKLTMKDVLAMRQCSNVSFFHHVDDGGAIVCVKNVPQHKRGPFDVDQRRYEIKCDTKVRHYKGDGSVQFDTRFNCFASVHNNSNESEWGTIAGLLKAGDVVSLYWQGADNSGYVNDSRIVKEDSHAKGEKLYHDRLYLKVKRGNKNLSFYVDDSVCPNNSARMIRPV